jgi:hypothetical protein
MDRIIDIVREEVIKYAGGGIGGNIRLFPVCDDIRHIYTVNAVDYPNYRELAGVVVLARIVGDKVVIEHDATDKPLLEALMARGIPREQIILAYASEPVPDPVKLW